MANFNNSNKHSNNNKIIKNSNPRFNFLLPKILIIYLSYLLKPDLKRNNNLMDLKQILYKVNIPLSWKMTLE